MSTTTKSVGITAATLAFAASALTAETVCTFDRDCKTLDDCTQIDYPITTSGLYGPVTLTLPDQSAPLDGAANPTSEGRIVVNGSDRELFVLMNINADATAHALVETPTDARILFGRCAMNGTS
ncbi:hypothetical protein [Salibaculum halophilum]|uniref:hypothetical protein n=1 Tax=Salibaculum halophilum TaxID=1914408 RepID=UPI000A11FF01|nr:hypothetical protein [Salibaculum halophilum]